VEHAWRRPGEVTWTVAVVGASSETAEVVVPVWSVGRSRHAAAITGSPARIDLGITSDHTAVVVEGAGGICARRRARSTAASPAALEAAALDGAALGTRLVVVVEPTGPAWLPVAVCFGRRGHTVLRVTSGLVPPTCAGSLPATPSATPVDAETLARLPLVTPPG
jgi:hypothetical protein